MIQVSIGNTFDENLLKVLNERNKDTPNFQVKELFGSLSGFGMTCRSADRLPKHTNVWLKDYNDLAESLGMHLVWTLNTNCVGNIEDFSEKWPAIGESIDQLYHIGIHSFIIAHPLVMELVRNLFPNAHLEVSTVAEVETATKLAYWHSLGADSICGKNSLNREINVLMPVVRAAYDMGMTYRFIVNELCLKDCPWRNACYLASSHDSRRQVFNGWPFGRCSDVRVNEPWRWISAPYILPQWLEEYKKLIHDPLMIKIVGRTSTTEQVLKADAAYRAGEFSGNLLDLWPGIEHLAGKGPSQMYIDCGKLDKYKSNLMYKCTGKVCGESCDMCGAIYAKCRG